MTSLLLLVCLGASAGLLGTTEVAALPPEARQFDFWVGEWDVVNRLRNADGTWEESRSRAQIRSVLDGRVIVEHWNGRVRKGPTIGFSARTFDPDLGRWVLLLNWPGTAAGSFGSLQGNFRHGRGEFLSGQAPNLTRYTFCDTTATSLRWDSAVTKDGGASWATNWIMEWTRRPPTAAPLTPEDLHVYLGQVPQRSAGQRQLDFLIGEWTGVVSLGEGEDASEHELRYRAESILDGRSVMEFFESDHPRANFFTVGCYQPKPGRWTRRGIHSDRPGFSHWQGTSGDGELTFEEQAPDGTRRRVRYSELMEDFFHLEESISHDGGSTWQMVFRADLDREARGWIASP